MYVHYQYVHVIYTNFNLIHFRVYTSAQKLIVCDDKQFIYKKNTSLNASMYSVKIISFPSSTIFLFLSLHVPKLQYSLLFPFLLLHPHSRIISPFMYSLFPSPLHQNYYYSLPFFSFPSPLLENSLPLFFPLSFPFTLSKHFRHLVLIPILKLSLPFSFSIHHTKTTIFPSSLSPLFLLQCTTYSFSEFQ